VSDTKKTKEEKKKRWKGKKNPFVYSTTWARTFDMITERARPKPQNPCPPAKEHN
jgi:hypothetical protein